MNSEELVKMVDTILKMDALYTAGKIASRQDIALNLANINVALEPYGYTLEWILDRETLTWHLAFKES